MVVLLGSLSDDLRYALNRAPFIIGNPYNEEPFLGMYASAIKMGLAAYGEMLLKDGRVEHAEFFSKTADGIDVDALRACAVEGRK